MNAHRLANPFSIATVVVADDYVDTFPHPHGLITYLHRLCLQLDIDIVSLERPVTVKGSWKTIVKIDAFLKTLISTLHSAISKGAVPNEEDFSSVFAHFEEENSYQTESLEGGHAAQTVHVSGDLSPLKTDDFLEVLKIDEESTDSTILDKWYFNANPRGKTINKRTHPSVEKQPPEPYVIVEADSTTKASQANLGEIEHALSMVYKKETIEKYQKKSCEKQPHQMTVSAEFDSVQEAVNLDCDNGKSAPVSESLTANVGADRKLNVVTENCDSKTEVMLENESERLVPKSDDCKEKVVNNFSELSAYETQNTQSLPHKLRQRTRHQNSQRKKAAECIGGDVTVHKRKKEYRKGRKQKKNDRTNIKDGPRVTNDKPPKRDGNMKEKMKRADWKTLRCDNKKSAKDDPHQANQKIVQGATIQEKAMTTEIGQDISLVESKIKTRASLKLCKPIEKRNKEKRNQHKKEALYVEYRCNQCPYVTSKQLQLLEHKRRVHLTKRFQCENCLKEFGFRKDLRRHMKCHTKAENCCDMCGKMYKEVRKLIEHKRIHAEDYVKPEFPCKFCSKKFSTKYVLAYHIKSDHLGMKRSYICPTCGKSFSQKNSYLQHANVHLGIKPFACDVCGKKFSYDKSLKEHKFMHNEDKVFSCSLCDKSFRQASGLAIHLKVHKTTKDYVCSMCGKGFSQKQALVRHERIHGGEKPYECGLCKRTFADSSVLRRHMILIHKRDPKQWRQDTFCHIPKRTDFFISVLDGDSSHSKDCEKFDEAFTKKQHNQQLNRCFQQGTQIPYGPGHPLPGDDEAVRSVTVAVMPGHYDMMTKEQSAFTNLREPAAIGEENYVSCPDIKPNMGYGPEKDVSNSFISSITAASKHHTESSLLSSTTFHNHSTSPLEVHSSIAGPAQSLRSVPHQHPTAAHSMQSQLLPAPNSSSFMPVTYHQQPVSYDTNDLQSIEMQPVQYSAMMAQPYSQTIVVLQDSLGTITYHQPGVSVAFPGENTAQNVHLQHIGSSASDMSQPMTSVPSEQMYDRVLSVNHPH